MKIKDVEDALEAINAAWMDHDENGIVRLTMKQTQLISRVLTNILLERKDEQEL